MLVRAQRRPGHCGRTGEAGNGNCSNKAAVRDVYGHGTHVASTIAAPVNGVGIAGVAPDATIVALKACTASTYCFGYAVAAALRYAGDHDIDIVNMSLFADPYLYYCGNDADQRAMMRELQSAARYAQQHTSFFGAGLVDAAGRDRPLTHVRARRPRRRAPPVCRHEGQAVTASG